MDDEKNDFCWKIGYFGVYVRCEKSGKFGKKRPRKMFETCRHVASGRRATSGCTGVLEGALGRAGERMHGQSTAWSRACQQAPPANFFFL